MLLVANPAPVSQQQQSQAVIDSWQPADLRAAQLADPEICPIIEALESSSTLPKWEYISRFGPMVKRLYSGWDRLLLKDGVLYRRYLTPNGLYTHEQLVVPSDRREITFALLHRSLTGGHVLPQNFRKDSQEILVVWCEHVSSNVV